VMMANVSWKVANTTSGIVPETDAGVTPFRKTLPKLPKNELRFVTPLVIPVVSNATL
jgi:hypothetical protein